MSRSFNRAASFPHGITGHVLHLENPAARWDDASPVGCGSLGAMVCGGDGTETISLSEESIWSSNPPFDGDPEFRAKIERLRDLFRGGDISSLDDDAQRLLGNSMRTIASCEYAGVVTVAASLAGETAEYSRDLDLTEGVLRVGYVKGGVRVGETAFCSHPKRLAAVRFEYSSPVSLRIAYKREDLTSLEYTQEGFFARGLTAKGEHAFAVGARIETDGVVSACGEGIAVGNAKTLALYLSAATEFSLGEDFCALLEKRLALKTPFGDLLREHVRDFTALSWRSDLVLEGDPALSRLPVGARLERLRNDPGARDPALAALYFAFGKYLLISSSRADTLPANLQGVWVESLENAWNADYHTNINLQMNYWQAETADLGECCEALFRYMNGILLPAGARVARESYGCRGAVVHHLSDIYGYAAPADGLWGLWPHGAGWLSTHLWEHYLFTRDEGFLRGTAYDFMKACALFYMDYMFEDRGGRLVSGPSTSPENRYYLPVGDEKREMFLCFSPTMDIEIISAVLRNYIDAEEILGSDPETREAARRALSRMPALTVGPDGRLNEWLEPYEEPEPGHRHISHAFALYPDHAIGPDTPELLDAIRKTLEKRLSCGGGHTGWSRAWLINLFARLGDGGAAGEHLRLLLTRSTLPNLLDTHPPFQIDGNFGGAAGVGEMLLQSRNDEISICPAVPDWFSGSFRGFKARGNIEVGAEIDRGRPTGFSLRPAFDGAYTVRLPRDGTVEFNGTKISTDRGAFRVTLSAGRETVFHVEWSA